MKKNLTQMVFGICMLVLFSTTVDAQWTQTSWPTSTSFFQLSSSQDRVFARTWDSLNGGRMFFSSNSGSSWTLLAPADSNTDLLSAVALSTTSFLAGTWNGFYKSTNSGTSWSAVSPTGIVYAPDSTIWAMAMVGTTLYAGATGDLYKSADNGTTWSEVKSGIPANDHIVSIVGVGSAVLAATDSLGVFLTTNGGTSWAASNSGLTDLHISQLTVIGSKVFALTLNGVFVSTNNGASWSADGSGLNNVNCFAVANNQLFAGTDSSGIYRSIDNGASWNQISTGIPAGSRVWSLAATSDAIYAGTSAGVWRSAFTTIVVAPATPALVSPSNGAAGQPTAVTLSWNSANLAKKYNAQLSSVQDFSSLTFNGTNLTGLTAAVSGLAYLNTYYWRVNAVNDSGSSAWSTVNSFTVMANPAWPSTPVLASPSNGITGQPFAVTLAWNAATNATSYSFQLSTAASFAATVAGGTGLTSLNTAPVGIASYSTVYYWHVTASNSSGTAAWSTTWSFVTLADPNQPPVTPTLTAPTNNARNQPVPITLTWGSVTGAATYSVQVSSSMMFMSTIYGNSVTTTSVSVPGLAYNTRYYWRVNATNSAGSSAWTTASNFTTVSTSVLEQSALLVNKVSFANGRLAYSVSQKAPVSIMIYDLRGKSVLDYTRMQSEGSYIFNLADRHFSPGRYIVRFKAGSMDKRMAVQLVGRR